MRDVYTRAGSKEDLSSPRCLQRRAPRRPPAVLAPAHAPPPLRPLPALAPRGARRGSDECEEAAEAVEPAERGGGGGGAPGRGRPPRAPAREAVRGTEELPCRPVRDPADAAPPGPEARPSAGAVDARSFVTLPRMRGLGGALWRRARLPPRRTTPDGTDIYYWCDLPRRPPHGTRRPELSVCPHPPMSRNLAFRGRFVRPFVGRTSSVTWNRMQIASIRPASTSELLT